MPTVTHIGGKRRLSSLEDQDRLPCRVADDLGQAQQRNVADGLQADCLFHDAAAAESYT